MGSRRELGFTLVELLVVFAILALVIGLAPVAFGRLRDSADYRDTVRTMMTQLRAARFSAMAEGREVRFAVDMRNRQYGVDTARKTLPSSIELRATVAGTDLSAQGEAAIRFLPGGGATGGSIEILRAPSVGIRLRVDWLSGRVSQEALGP